MKKSILGAAVLIAALGGVLMVSSGLNAFIARVIERHGSTVTGSDVNVSGVKVSVRDGSGAIRGLTVGNPSGFSAGDCFTFEEISIRLDPAALAQDPVVLQEVRVSAPLVRAEFTRDGSSNLDALRRRVDEYAANPNALLDGEREVRIASLVLEEGVIEVDADALGLESRTMTLPAIRLTDVGGGPEGIARSVLSAVARKATTRLAGSEAERLIRDQLGDALSDKASGLLDQLGK